MLERFWPMTSSAMRCLVVALLIGMPCLSLGAESAEGVIKSRIANFREIGTAFKYVEDELKRSDPDEAGLMENVRLIKESGAHIPSWFPPGSQPVEQSRGLIDSILAWFSPAGSSDSRQDSHAKPEIWTDGQGFQKAFQRFKSESERMLNITKGGRTDLIEMQYRLLGETCRACHKKYRERTD